MTAPNAASVPPPEVMPRPLPTSVLVQTTEGEQRWVVVTILDATGQRVVFLDPDAAQTIGGLIRAAGKQTKSPLSVPPAGRLIVPGGPP